MQLTDEQVLDLFSRLASIEAKLEARPGTCAVHEEKLNAFDKRIVKVEDKLASVQTVIGKKELVVAAFGAIGVGLGFAIKAMVAILKG